LDKHTKAIYKRGALFIVPILAVVGCRVGLRACVALQKTDRRHEREQAMNEQYEQEQAAALATALATASAKQQARARSLPTAEPGSVLAPVATAQQVPDALVADADSVAWLATRAGEVMVAPRAGGPAHVVARAQKLPQRRHAQATALAFGWVYWTTSTLTADGEEDGAIFRARTSSDGTTEPEVVVSDIGGVSALAIDKDGLYFARSLRVSRDEEGNPSGGVFRVRLDKEGRAVKDADGPEKLLAAERPCAIAVDDAAVFAVEPLKVWRAPKSSPKPAPNKKAGEATKAIVTSADRLGCSVAVDDANVYWTVPGDDSLMRAKKTDGSRLDVVAFVRKRPAMVVVDRGYAYVLAETSPQGLGEMGSIFRVPIRSEHPVAQALVTEQVGLMSVAAYKGFVAFSMYNDAESDGLVMSIANDPLAVDAGK